MDHVAQARSTYLWTRFIPGKNNLRENIINFTYVYPYEGTYEGTKVINKHARTHVIINTASCYLILSAVHAGRDTEKKTRATLFVWSEAKRIYGNHTVTTMPTESQRYRETGLFAQHETYEYTIL